MWSSEGCSCSALGSFCVSEAASRQIGSMSQMEKIIAFVLMSRISALSQCFVITDFENLKMKGEY